MIFYLQILLTLKNNFYIIKLIFRKDFIMKKKLIFVTTLILILFSTISLGNTLTLKLNADKKSVKKGDIVKISVNWDQNMQAADFSLTYDGKILKYLNSDVDEYCKICDNETQVAWFSMEDKDKTSLEFEFEAIGSGKTTVSTKINAGFADGNLNQPTDYNTDSIEIKVKSSSFIITISIVIIAIIIILIFIRLFKMKKKKNSRLS